jgi:hypothetical protein
VCTATGDQAYPAMTGDGSGGAVLAWEDQRNGATDIYAGRVGANGKLTSTWPTNGLALCTAVQDQVAPVIAPDATGGAFVAWEDYRAGGANSNVYVQHATGAGAIATGWPANGVAVCTSANTQGHPSIVRDGSGGAIVVWEDFRSGGADLYAQRITAAGLPQWTANGVALCTAAGDQRFPMAVSDGSGGAIVVWEDSRNGASDVYAQRITAAGSVQWTTDGVPVCTATSDQIAVRAASDGAGGAVITWEDHRADNSDAYAQRINGNGAPLWTMDGLALCTEASEQYSEAIAGDGVGGAFVTWVDLRNGLSDIYAQHATAAGAIATGWGVDGNAICSVTGNQFDPLVVNDGSGGAYFAWNDTRPGTASTDVFALRVTGAGAVSSGWPAGGSVFCSATGDQLVTALQPDGAGGALIGWFDRRSTSADIYALRINGAGGVPTVDVGDPATPGTMWLAAGPNPVSSTTTLHFALETETEVTAGIIDVTGRRVRELLRGIPLPAGGHDLTWDGCDASGARVPAGIYLAVVQAGSQSRVEKLAVLR